MGIILSKNKEEIIKILKKLKEHVFQVTTETIYAIPEGMVAHYSDYNDFLKFTKEHPIKVFRDNYFIMKETTEIKEL